MKKEIYIHHHLGLGDHFVCNGIVRYVYSQYRCPIFLAVKHHNVPTVKDLYSDTNILLDPVSNDKEAISNYGKRDVLRVGFEKCDVKNWEKSFYEQCNLPYEARFSESKITRNKEKEDNLFNSLKLPKKYAFCSNQCSAGNVEIDFKTKLPKVFLSKKTDSLMDWLKIIETATEIHTIDSSVFQLIKNMQLDRKKFLYDIRSIVHRTPYSKELDENWNIVTVSR
tara:strand:- start:12 stop:683 length:672 start_codon:yes stop_codon:yes gene_type:complete